MNLTGQQVLNSVQADWELSQIIGETLLLFFRIAVVLSQGQGLSDWSQNVELSWTYTQLS